MCEGSEAVCCTAHVSFQSFLFKMDCLTFLLFKKGFNKRLRVWADIEFCNVWREWGCLLHTKGVPTAHVSFQSLEKDDMAAECWSDSWDFKNILQRNPTHFTKKSNFLKTWMLIGFMRLKNNLLHKYIYRSGLIFYF